jgi:PHD/YefM family antitoxin component YafN of YafNO toxin-antitoxin module
MKVVKLESKPDLDALVKAVERSKEPEAIALERCGVRLAVIISASEYANFLALEEALNDKLDAEESEEILKDPQWVEWDELRKQPKS